ncbi:hypothetical protein GvMRE_IIg389 [endosymbiont GvMRE of Glomus versiforme]|nr:hypothetical protein GvMRE_IIg389 [endosymbiont GvMRE of Glomus versiforme]
MKLLNPSLTPDDQEYLNNNDSNQGFWKVYKDQLN